MSSVKYQLTDLLELMARLRDPQSGCPWDIKQSYQTITNSTIEEAYEVVDAIEQGDFDHLKEELGDLLFQVVFYTQLSREDGLFTFEDIVDTLTAKLIRRHPHVFPDGTLESRQASTAPDAEAVKRSWEAIKKDERQKKGRSRLLDDVPIALPAIARASKLQKRAASVGFDWLEWRPVVEKVKEELAEFEEAMEQNDDRASEEELGDLMFSVVNLARHCKLDPERTLRKANKKFTERFNFIEDCLNSRGENLQTASSEQMEALWEQAKTEQ